MEPAVAIGVAAVIGVATAAATRPILRWLTRTRHLNDEPPYAALGTRAFVAGCGGAAGTAAGVSGLLLPLALQPAWWVLATAGVVLAAVDARTTWLPWRLTRLAWGLMLFALPAGLLLGGSPAVLMLHAPIGAAVAGLVYLAAWACTRGGFGFGDVRYAPLLGAAAAAHSWALLGWTLFLGTIVGGLMGLGRLLRRRREPFPYGPSMLLGGYLATALLALS